MKDKEKQIEEMAEIVCNACRNNEHCYCRKQPCQVAEKEVNALYEQGYRKIDKDSVVLSREEFESLIKPNKLDLQEQASYIRKETAEKIFNELWYVIKNHCGYEEFIDKDDLKYYAKQFGVEIKEYKNE